MTRILWFIFAPAFIIMGIISAIWLVRMSRTAIYGNVKDEDDEPETADGDSDEQDSDSD